MKFPSITSVPPLEVALFVIFILYLIFPIPTPAFLIKYINGNIGIAVIIIVTLYMLFYTTPILGVLTIFVAYELLRRSNNGLSRAKVPMVRHTASQPKKDAEMAKMNPTVEVTLEEEVIGQMAPVGKSSVPEKVVGSTFKPVQDTIAGASMLS